MPLKVSNAVINSQTLVCLLNVKLAVIAPNVIVATKS